MPTSHRLFVGLLAVTVFGLAEGCVSSTLPPTLTAEQLALASSPRIGGVVAVEIYKYPVYSEGLKAQLIESRLFDTVDFTESVKNPTLVARIERRVSGSSVIPLWTGISLGLIPTIVTERHGYAFSLRRPTSLGAPTMVDATYSGTSVLGWAALFRNLSPDAAWSNPKKTERFRLFFRWATAKAAMEVLAAP